jgi:hypothetical protein
VLSGSSTSLTTPVFDHRSQQFVPAAFHGGERPWCYYCERDFDDARVLLSHQKAKHFRCNHCNRRLNTAGGFSVHLQQVHKETLTKVENAIDGREGVDPEIFGMCDVPEDLVKAPEGDRMLPWWPSEYPALLVEVECLSALCPGQYDFAYNRIDFRQNHCGAATAS